MKFFLKFQEPWRDFRRGSGTLAERTERNADVLIFTILALALVLRLVFLVAFHAELTTRIEKGFAYPAMNFVSGHGMGISKDCPTSYRAPLYILFLIPFYAVFGVAHYAWPLGLAQMAVGLASVYLVYLIGKEWRSKRVGLLGALFMAVYPYNLYHDTQFYITFLFTFLMLLTVLGLLRLERKAEMSQAVMTGVWIGLAMLATSGPMVFFAPLACAWLWWRWRDFGKALKFSAVMGLTALVIMAPWVARNYEVHREFVPLTTDGGRVFYKDYNPLAMSMLLNDLWIDATPEPLDSIPTPMNGVRKSGCDFMEGWSEPAADRFWYAKAKGWIGEHRGEMPALLGLKFTLLWHPWMYPPKGAEGGNGAIILSAAFMNWGYALSYGFLLTLALLELLLETKDERRRTALFVMLGLAFTLTYVITTPGTKYRVPFDSILALMAASACWRYGTAWRSRKNRPPETSRVLSIEALNDRPEGEALVVTPTYDERENIAAFITAIGGQGAADLMIVDDGSPDGTADEARRAASTAPMRVWLMRRPEKLGLGTAYMDAFAWIIASAPAYRVAVEMDADFSHDPSALSKIIAAARENGVGIGSRYVSGGSCPDWPWHRRALSGFANFYARRILNIRYGDFGIRDATAGYVAWRRDAIETLLSEGVGSNGYSFQIETKLSALTRGFKAMEVPIVFTDRTRGVSKISRSVIIESMLLPWKLLFKKPRRD